MLGMDQRSRDIHPLLLQPGEYGSGRIGGSATVLRDRSNQPSHVRGQHLTLTRTTDSIRRA
jgi:hypothetical protein